MGQEEFGTLLEFFKVLGNESRLKIIGILANRDCTVSELAAMLDVKEPTVSQHLSALKSLELVDVRAEGNYRYYSFNPNTLRGMNKDIFSREKLASLVEPFAETEDAYARKVFKTFLDGETITQIPTGEKRQLVLLKWLAEKFEFGVEYPEKQVNAIISRHHPDFATLRRDLVDFKFMDREKGIYWRVEKATHNTEPDL
jgi:hypothetical protein